MDDASYQAMAKSAIDYFGSSSAVVLRTETVSIDPVTGLPTPSVESETTTGVVVGIGDRVSTSEEFRVTDEVLLIPNVAITVSTDTTVQRNSIAYKVVAPLPKRPGASTIYTELVVREIS